MGGSSVKNTSRTKTLPLSAMAAPPITPHHLTDSLEHCIRHRHSIRFYKQDAVDHDILRDCLRLAQLAPSNSNMQNWRLVLASGPGRDRIVQSLLAAASQGEPNVPPLPEKFKQFRSEFGRTLYGAEGYDIPRGDKKSMTEARLRNFEFFGAPVVGVVSLDRDLDAVDAMSVGMFVQTFMLALTEQGLGSCLQVSVTGYPDVLRTEFGLTDDHAILCGIAIGWPAEHKVNNLHIHREPLEKEVRFITE